MIERVDPFRKTEAEIQLILQLLKTPPSYHLSTGDPVWVSDIEEENPLGNRDNKYTITVSPFSRRVIQNFPNFLNQMEQGKLEPIITNTEYFQNYLERLKAIREALVDTDTWNKEWRIDENSSNYKRVNGEIVAIDPIFRQSLFLWG